MKKESQWSCPVPIAPLPRRDDVEKAELYCRLMLLFFKPWRQIFDLKPLEQSWESAFNEFVNSEGCTQKIAQMMRNMQMLHECKDSRDNHFAQRRAHISFPMRDGSSNWTVTDDTEEAFDDSEILDHLLEIDGCHSQRVLDQEQRILDVLEHARDAGMCKSPLTQNSTQELGDIGEKIDDSLSNAINMESLWASVYDDRRSQARKCRGRQQDSKSPMMTDSEHHAWQDALTTIEPQICCTSFLTKEDLDIDQFSTKWTLNNEQKRAFTIIANQIIHEKGGSPLRMFISGQAGTGKSRVINAVKDLLEVIGETGRFQLGSYMGIAARNISGSTLHSLLSISQLKNATKNTSKTRIELMNRWEGVDFLFIDEVSMISCQFMKKIHDALCIAKGNDLPFGGINIIFAGDFAQLPPVAEKRLYAKLDLKSKKATKRVLDVMHGKLLWHSVQTVVVLTQIHRQGGEENRRFTELLGRLRCGKCNRSDIELLKSRVIGHEECSSFENDKGWRDAPVLVYDNAAKDALNIERAKAFTQRCHQSLTYYYAEDHHQQRLIEDDDLNDFLLFLDTGR